MICKNCNTKKSIFDLVFDETTFETYCTSCYPEGTPYTKLEDFLKEVYPEVYKLKNKVTSARLDLDNLLYTLKFAQHAETTSMSQTVNEMITKLRGLYSLDDVELSGVPFEKAKEKELEKDKVDFAFLEPKEQKERKVTLDKPKPQVVNVGNEDAKDDEDDGVITI